MNENPIHSTPMTQSKTRHHLRWLPLWCNALALVTLWLGMRTFAEDTLGMLLRISTLGLLVLAWIMTPRARQVSSMMKHAFLYRKWGLGLQIVAAVALWCTRMSWFKDWIEHMHRPWILVVCLLLLGAGIILHCFWHASLSTEMYITQHVPLKTLGRQQGVLWIASCVFLGAVGFTYASTHSEWEWRLAPLAPTSPSAATVSVLDVSSCGENKQKPEVYLFFEKGSEAWLEVRSYFEALQKHGALVYSNDQAAEPVLAKELKIQRNGMIGFRCDKRTEFYFLGETRKEAQRKLAKLDEEIRGRLGRVAKEPVVIYATVGHGERSFFDGSVGDRTAASVLEGLLGAQNATVKTLGSTDGLGREIPENASMVIVHGPVQPFLPNETSSLMRYLDRGGSLLLLLDSTTETTQETLQSLQPLLSMLAVNVRHGELINDKEYMKVNDSVADRSVVGATAFASHAVMKGFSAVRNKAAVVFESATAVEPVTAQGPKAPKVTVLVRSRSEVFLDTNGNRQFDTQERRDAYSHGVAVEGSVYEDAETKDSSHKNYRAVLWGDSHMANNTWLRNEANAALMFQSTQWLLRDDEVMDAPLRMDGDLSLRTTASADAWAFYITTFVPPLVILLTGFWIIFRRRQNRSVSQ